MIKVRQSLIASFYIAAKCAAAVAESSQRTFLASGFDASAQCSNPMCKLLLKRMHSSIWLCSCSSSSRGGQIDICDVQYEIIIRTSGYYLFYCVMKINIGVLTGGLWIVCCNVFLNPLC